MVVVLLLSSIQARVCFIQLSSSRLTKSSRACYPLLSFLFAALSTVTTACTIRLSHSRASIKSVFHIKDLSCTLISSLSYHISLISFCPSSKTSPVLNTAQLFCITFCIIKRNYDVLVEQLAFLNLSNLSNELCPASFGNGA